MKNILIFFICSFFVLTSCSKGEPKKKCEDCIYKIYSCDKEGGEVRWKVNGKNEVVSAGYFTANQGAWGFPPETQQNFDFGGNFESCTSDISGSTASSENIFSIGNFKRYLPLARFKDFCGENTIIGGGQNGSLTITSYDGVKASGEFYMHQRTGGATQCKPDEWEIVGSFINVPVY